MNSSHRNIKRSKTDKPVISKSFVADNSSQLLFLNIFLQSKNRNNNKLNIKI